MSSKYDTDHTELQQVNDIININNSNLSIGTIRVYANSDLDFGVDYTILTSKIPTTNNSVINKHFIDNMTFPFARLTGQINTDNQIADNSIQGIKVSFLDYSRLINKPSAFNSRISMLVIDQTIDLLHSYKIVNSLDPLCEQNLVTLSYLNSYDIPYDRISNVP